MPTSRSRRVVITGAGLVSPLGNTREKLWQALQEGRSGIRPLTQVPGEVYPSMYGAEALEFTGNIDDFGPLEKTVKRNIRKGLNVMCREIEMGVAVAQLAMTDASFNPADFNPDRTGVVYGSDHIMTMPEEFTQSMKKCIGEDGKFDFNRWADYGLKEVAPLWLLKYLPNMPASHIAIYNDLRGPNNSLTLREASSNAALGEAFCTITRGSADRIIAGATGTRVHPIRTVHITLQEEIAPGNDQPPETLSRPFELNRQGMVLGEGAGAVMMEEFESAQGRGAKILGEVVGYGSSTVADAKAVPNRGKALENVMLQALQSAGLKPEEVGHIHAHGLGTRQCDAEEAAAIRAVFGETRVPVTAAKSYFGNLGAGGGVVELIASLSAINEGPLFPVLNYDTPDPACDIHVAQGELPAGDCFLSTNVSPQGQASAIAVCKFR